MGAFAKSSQAGSISCWGSVSHTQNKTSIHLDFCRLPGARLRSSIRKQGLWQESLDPSYDSLRILLNLKRVTRDFRLLGSSTLSR